MNNHNISNGLKDLWSSFKQIIFPSVCFGCQLAMLKQESFICTKCLISLPYYTYGSFSKKFNHFSSVECAEAFLLFVKKGLTQKLIYEIKYNGNQLLAHRLGAAFAYDLKDSFDFKGYDYIVPVPLHKRKYKKRGFNQSEEIAKGICDVSKIEMRTDLVERVIDTKTQTGKGRLTRLFSLRNAFEIVSNKAKYIKGKNVILIDDVVTTGATISEIIERLESAGVRRVAILTLSTQAW